MISDDGRALIHDFGRSLLRKFSSSISVPGPGGCALNWMAPEILDSGNVSTEADVWAFGMTTLVCFHSLANAELNVYLQELFTRKSPFSGLNTSRITSRILEGPPHRPSDEETCSRMTNRWWELSFSCWNPYPSLRPAMSDIINKIGNVVYSQCFLRLLLPIN